MRFGSRKSSRDESQVPSPTWSVLELYVLLPGAAMFDMIAAIQARPGCGWLMYVRQRRFEGVSAGAERHTVWDWRELNVSKALGGEGECGAIAWLCVGPARGLL
jgi:hypothetical protein